MLQLCYITTYDCKKLKSDLWKELENILTDTQIQVLKFRYIEKLTLQECSERLGISYQAVHAKTTNTVSKLKGNYKIRGLANKYLWLWGSFEEVTT